MSQALAGELHLDQLIVSVLHGTTHTNPMPESDLLGKSAPKIGNEQSEIEWAAKLPISLARDLLRYIRGGGVSNASIIEARDYVLDRLLEEERVIVRPGEEPSYYLPNPPY